MTFTQKLLQFITHHWLLVSGFLLAFIVLLVEEAKSQSAASINVQAAVQLINRGNVLILDLRDPDRFNEGYIAQARNVPNKELDQSVSKLSGFKQKTILLVSDQHPLALKTMAKLKKLGFQNVKTLSGGMRAWREAMMPVKKK